MSEYSNGAAISSEKHCLTQREFDRFLSDKWEPHSNKIEDTMEKLATSLDSIAEVMRWAAKGLFFLLCLLILINASSAIIQQLKDSGTSFKGNIGGPNGAAIELHQEKHK